MIKVERVEVVFDAVIPQTFTVEAINVDGEGAVDMTTFSGVDAEQRAKEYAAWKYQAAYSAKAA